MNYRFLLLGVVLLVKSGVIQTLDEIADKMNITEDGLSLPLYLSENKKNITEDYMSLQEMKTGDDSSYTAGNTRCREDNQCGYHEGTSYSWCYTDYSDSWDYCCTGSCASHGTEHYLWCQSGNQWQYCGEAGPRDVGGRVCLRTHQCGMHQDDQREGFYWCYVDVSRNWGKCCAPWSKCQKMGKSYYWCYTGYKLETHWKYCNP